MSDTSQTIILSLGGSVFLPDQLDVDFIKRFKGFIERYVHKGYKFIIITGGGKVCRRYQGAAGEIREISDLEKDWIGIHVTRMNAQFMRVIFGEHLACEEVLLDPEEKKSFEKPVMFGAGWLPGWSTDFDAVMAAKTYDVKKIVNLSNIEKVYTKDPHKFDDAQPIDEITWAEYRKIVGDEWKPGLNSPFDPIASKKAQEFGLEVYMLNGKNLDNLGAFLDGKDNYIGSVIRGN